MNAVARADCLRRAPARAAAIVRAFERLSTARATYSARAGGRSRARPVGRAEPAGARPHERERGRARAAERALPAGRDRGDAACRAVAVHALGEHDRAGRRRPRVRGRTRRCRPGREKSFCERRHVGDEQDLARARPARRSRARDRSPPTSGVPLPGSSHAPPPAAAIDRGCRRARGRSSIQRSRPSGCPLRRSVADDVRGTIGRRAADHEAAAVRRRTAAATPASSSVSTSGSSTNSVAAGSSGAVGERAALRRDRVAVVRRAGRVRGEAVGAGRVRRAGTPPGSSPPTARSRPCASEVERRRAPTTTAIDDAIRRRPRGRGAALRSLARPRSSSTRGQFAPRLRRRRAGRPACRRTSTPSNVAARSSNVVGAERAPHLAGRHRRPVRGSRRGRRAAAARRGTAAGPRGRGRRRVRRRRRRARARRDLRARRRAATARPCASAPPPACGADARPRRCATTMRGDTAMRETRARRHPGTGTEHVGDRVRRRSRAGRPAIQRPAERARCRVVAEAAVGEDVLRASRGRRRGRPPAARSVRTVTGRGVGGGRMRACARVVALHQELHVESLVADPQVEVQDDDRGRDERRGERCR